MQLIHGAFKNQITQGGRPKFCFPQGISNSLWVSPHPPYGSVDWGQFTLCLTFAKWETEALSCGPSLCRGKLRSTIEKIVKIISALTVGSEKFIHGRAQCITILRALPTAKRLCSELNTSLFRFTFTLKLNEKEQQKLFPLKVTLGQRSVSFKPSKSEDE